MKRLAIALLLAVAGYVVAAVVSHYLVSEFSPNRHDRALEAAMTSVFVYGPLGAVASFVVGLILVGRRSATRRRSTGGS